MSMSYLYIDATVPAKIRVAAQWNVWLRQNRHLPKRPWT